MRFAFRAPHSVFQGFTILELLTAMAVLALVLVMMVQVVNGLLQSTRTQNQQMDSVATARRAVDVMATDLNNSIIGENATILVPDAAGSNLFALLTSRRGSSGASDHRFLAVRYSTNSNSQLIRSYGSVGFGETNLLSGITYSSNSVEPLASGILAIHIRALAEATNSYPFGSTATANWSTDHTYNGFLLPSGYNALLTRSPSFASSLTNRTRAIEVWIAAVDDQNYRLLNSASLLETTKALLGGDPTAWRSVVDSAAIPSQAKSGIRILNKTIPLR